MTSEATVSKRQLNNDGERRSPEGVLIRPVYCLSNEHSKYSSSGIYPDRKQAARVEFGAPWRTHIGLTSCLISDF